MRFGEFLSTKVFQKLYLCCSSPSTSKQTAICTPVGKPVNVAAPVAQSRQSGPRLPSLTNIINTNTSFSNLLDDDDDDFDIRSTGWYLKYKFLCLQIKNITVFKNLPIASSLNWW